MDWGHVRDALCGRDIAKVSFVYDGVGYTITKTKDKYELRRNVNWVLLFATKSLAEITTRFLNVRY